jgi:hypothetical protein
MAMIYVALAYILTWVNTLQTSSNYQVYLCGQNLGSLWLSILPIVICNLQLSPPSNFNRINAALDSANESFSLAAEGGEPVRCHGAQTITICTAQWDMVDEDKIFPTPIFFYAHFYTWFRAVLRVSHAFDTASQNASNSPKDDEIGPRTRPEVIEYCTMHSDKDGTNTYDLVNIYLKSTALAAFLQWGMTGTTVMATYLTPTRGEIITSDGMFTHLPQAWDVIQVHNYYMQYSQL